MAPKIRSGNTKKVPVPLSPVVTDSVPASIPTTSRDGGQLLVGIADGNNSNLESKQDTFWKYIHDREKGTFCGRTCVGWVLIVLYSIMYIIFLTTYTMIFLFGSLTIIKSTVDYQSIDKTELLTYSKRGIGLTATPTSEFNYPLISYKNGESYDYEKYITSLDKLLQKRRKRDINNLSDLGPCGHRPYGYGENPCVIIRINKQIGWSAKPLQLNSSITINAPEDVKNLLQLKQEMLWLHCEGYHSYDKEHIGSIKYYPDPPGFDPDLFPMEMQVESPLIAVQMSNFSLGLSLAIECKLWYDTGTSSVVFVLYVAPSKTALNLLNKIS